MTDSANYFDLAASRALQASPVPINILKASNLRKVDLIGKSDPFVLLGDLQTPQAKTKVVFKNLDPEWHEQFNWKSHGKPLIEFWVYDHNKLTSKEFLGYAELDIWALAQKQNQTKEAILEMKEPVKQRIELTLKPHPNRPKSKTRGTLTIEIEIPKYLLILGNKQIKENLEVLNGGFGKPSDLYLQAIRIWERVINKPEDKDTASNRVLNLAEMMDILSPLILRLLILKAVITSENENCTRFSELPLFMKALERVHFSNERFFTIKEKTRTNTFNQVVERLQLIDSSKCDPRDHYKIAFYYFSSGESTVTFKTIRSFVHFEANEFTPALGGAVSTILRNSLRKIKDPADTKAMIERCANFSKPLKEVYSVTLENKDYDLEDFKEFYNGEELERENAETVEKFMNIVNDTITLYNSGYKCVRKRKIVIEPYKPPERKPLRYHPAFIDENTGSIDLIRRQSYRIDY